MGTYGIYGYGVTRNTSLSFGEIIPLQRTFKEINSKIKNKDKLELTGFINLEGLNEKEEESYLFHLEIVLSFIEQRKVLIRHKLKKHESYDCLDSDYPLGITPWFTLSPGGSVIIEDSFSKNSRRNFIDVATNKMAFHEDKEFIQIIHKNVLTFSNPQNFVDVNYYLFFSGLEALARKRTSFTGNNTAQALFGYLKDTFFIKQQHNDNYLISLDSYVELRNSIFHNGKLVAKLKNRPFEQEVSLKDLYSCFKRLNVLSILRDAGFDDGYINWDFTNYRDTLISPNRKVR